MKKLIFSVLISFIIMTIANCSFAVTARVNVSAARIRESQSTESNIVTNAYKDDEVEILEENGEWSKVKYGEKTGYTKTEFLTKKEVAQENTVAEAPVENPETPQMPAGEPPVVDNEQTQSTPTVPANTEKNIGDSVSLPNAVKIRLIPNLSAIANLEIAQGTNVVVGAKLGNWYKIGNENVSGWVTKSKIEVTEPVPAVVPEENPVQAPVPEPVENTTPVNNVVKEQTEEPAVQPQEDKVTQTTPEPEESESLNKTTFVNVETARVREKASTNSDIVDMLDKGDKVTIIGEEGEFYKIKTDKISSGYISKKLLSEKAVTSRGNVERENNIEAENTVDVETNEAINQALEQDVLVSTSGNSVVEFAKQYLGYPYVLGCSSPESGFDCSGFTRYVFGHFGYKLGSVAANQTSVGAVVERENLQTGDLILFYNDAKTKIGHCGIYISGGDFIHSANPQRGVVIDNLNTNSYYNQRFVTARRVIE